MFQKGFLPVPGTWLDQPIKFSEAMMIIESTIDDLPKDKSDGE